MDLTATKRETVLATAREICYDERYLYPVGELFGTLWALMTHTLHRKNIFDDEYAIQCATFARMCYRSIGKDPLTDMVDHLSNTAPERLFQSTCFSFREVMV